jgi:hypothetical protein
MSRGNTKVSKTQVIKYVGVGVGMKERRRRRRRTWESKRDFIDNDLDNVHLWLEVSHGTREIGLRWDGSRLELKVRGLGFVCL